MPSGNSPGKQEDLSDKKLALEKACELIKYLTALSTGALVFGAGLAKEDLLQSSTARAVMVASWVFLAISSILGVLAYSRIPMMLSEGTADLNDRYLMFPFRLHQITFIAGILLLGTALTLGLIGKTDRAQLTALPCAGSSAQQKAGAPPKQAGSK
jgi:preprotein translocase subunit SecG